MRKYVVTGSLLLAALAVALLAGGASSGSGTYSVRAIFDNAAFVVKGEQVKVAGVSVGKITALDVTKDKKAAVTLEIDQPGFADFRQDAHCIIRPQSLIGEQFVECTPTRPTAPGQKRAPELPTIAAGRPGAGEHLLALQTKFGGGTSSPVGLDLLNDTLRMPYRQRLALIINELGTGLAGNTTELRQVIRRANPALAELDRVLAILASENKTLSQLAVNGDQSLTPLARERARVSSFVDRAGQVAQATAARRADLERNFQKLPTFLAELRPTVRRLGSFSDQATPVLADLRSQAPAINRLIRDLGPFSSASRPAFRALGRASRIGGPALVRSRPLARRLLRLGNRLQPVAQNARLLLRSFYNSGGVERAMDYLFFQVAAVNGFDPLGHYLRAGLITESQCQSYAQVRDDSCSANFGNGTGLAGTKAQSASVRSHLTTADQIKLMVKHLEAIGYKPASSGSGRRGGRSAKRAQGAANPLGGLLSQLGGGGSPGRPAAPAPATTAPPSTNSAPGPTASTPSTNGTGALLDYLLGGSK